MRVFLCLLSNKINSLESVSVYSVLFCIMQATKKAGNIEGRERDYLQVLLNVFCFVTRIFSQFVVSQKVFSFSLAPTTDQKKAISSRHGSKRTGAHDAGVC